MDRPLTIGDVMSRLPVKVSERTLGKGEVESSILSNSTTISQGFRPHTAHDARALPAARSGTPREHDPVLRLY